MILEATWDERYYAARNKNKEVLLQSSSGGVLIPLMQKAIQRGGAVVCSVYDYEKQMLRFRLLESEEDVLHVGGSKYIQSETGIVFLEAEKWLKNSDKEILFVGTGCQAEAFHKYMTIKGLRSRTVIVDIICHGVPSPQIWKDYVGYIQKTLPSFCFISFKDKRRGWLKPTAFVSDGTKEYDIDKYVKMYHTKNMMRPSCYECQFTTCTRNSDITVGDFWRVKTEMPSFFDPMGVSTVIVHTSCGKDNLDCISDQLECLECTKEQCLQPNLRTPTKRPESREIFWSFYKRYGIEGIVQKYGTMSVFKKVFRKLKNLGVSREDEM